MAVMISTIFHYVKSTVVTIETMTTYLLISDLLEDTSTVFSGGARDRTGNKRPLYLLSTTFLRQNLLYPLWNKKAVRHSLRISPYTFVVYYIKVTPVTPHLI